MSDQQQGGYGKGFLLGAVIGGAVGAVVALLFAPKSGRELRQDIADKGEELYNKASDLLNKDEEPSMVEDVYNEGKARAERIVTNARTQAESILSSAEQVLRDAKSRAQQIKETLK
jgi:gas vesicle protein